MRHNMKRQVISTSDAPQAIGPYSQAVRAGDFLFLSGQIPLDPATGELVAGDVAAQTKQVMENLGSVLRGGGVGFGEVVRATIYPDEPGGLCQGKRGIWRLLLDQPSRASDGSSSCAPSRGFSRDRHDRARRSLR